MMFQQNTLVCRTVLCLTLVCGGGILAGCDELQNSLNKLIPPASGSNADTTGRPSSKLSEVSGGADGAGAAVAPVPTSGPTYYVDQASGNDGNAGTAGSPWQTLGKAATAAQPGDTVIVKAGTYNERFQPTNSGTAGGVTVFRSETPRGAAIIGGVDLSGADYVRVEGFDITNAAAEACAVQVQAYGDTSHGHGVQIANNYIHDGGGHAVWAANVTDLLVENNEMYNNYHDGVIVTGGSKNNSGVTIRGNYIHHNGQDGVHAEGQNILIDNNGIGDQYETDQHQDGLEIYGPIDGLIIRNNRIWDTTQNIYLSAENSYIRNVQVLGNVIWSQNNPNLGKGIFVTGSVADVTNVRIEGNTIAYVSTNMMTDGYAPNSGCYISGLTIRDNIFYMCDLSLGLNNPATIDYNIHYYPGYFSLVSANGTSYTSLDALRQAFPGWEQNSLQADPLFVNPDGRDFHLTPNSPAIDKGTPIDGLAYDADGNNRSQGGGVDIGAYEAR